MALIAPPYFDVPPSAYGGIEAVVADLADALVDRGHSVTLVGAGQCGTSADFVPVWDTIIPDRLGQAMPEVLHAASTVRAVQRLAETSGVDLVHDHTVAGPLNAAAYTAMGLPTLVTAHGPVDKDFGRLYRLLGENVYMIAISERQRELAPDLNWISVVHNALRVQTWPYRSQKDGYAVFLGRFHPDKGPHLALDAAHAAGLPLVLAGKCADPVEKQYFESEVRPRLGPDDHVIGVADAAVKRRLLVNARCLLFPIQWEEPFGMVMIEAMACGTPIVALRGGAVTEVVRHGVTGIVCSERHELPDALQRVKEINPAACRQHVVDNFDSDGLARGHEVAYRAALAQHRDYSAADVDLAILQSQYPDLDAALDLR